MPRTVAGRSLLLVVLTFSSASCSTCGPVSANEMDSGSDAGTVNDAGADAGATVDSGADAGADAGAIVDAGSDAGVDAGCQLTLVRIINRGGSCNISAGGGAMSAADEQVLCVNQGPIDLKLSPRADFQLGEAPWHGTDGDFGAGDTGTRSALTLGGWTTTTPLPSGRGRFGAVAANGYLYAIGGSTINATSEVLYAVLASDGGVGAWNTTTPLPTPLLALGAAVHRGRVYVAGGWDGTAAHGELLAATIQPDGSLGSWTTASNFGNGRSYAELIAQRGHLVVLGGNTGGTFVGDGRMASFDDAGVLSGWATTPAFSPGRVEFGAAASGSSLFIVGGTTMLARLDDVQSSVFDSAGSLGSWSAAPPLAGVHTAHALVAYGRSLFALGGYGGIAGYQNDVQIAALDRDGGVSAWIQDAPFPTPRMEHRAVAYGGFIYVLGGYQNQLLTDVQLAPVLGNISTATLTIGATTRCAWACCEGLDGTECPTTNPCP